MKSPLDVIGAYPPHDYSLHGAFMSRLERDPGRPFIVFEGRDWSWQEFHDLALGAANVLANPKRLLQAMPAALHEIGVAITVALSVASQIGRASCRERV